jgi:isopentenyl diphosphate isomerase/L-lactate dehydrogenase-like FMN-dependent dehydrogenase
MSYSTSNPCVCAADFENQAVALWAARPDVLAWVRGGAGDESTLKANRAAFDQWQIMPRVLHDCAAGSTRLELFGQHLRHPIVLAPVGHQGLIHPGGECEIARAAVACATLMVSSTQSTCSLEQIAEVGGQRWFQLYFQSRRSQTLTLVRRAEAAGNSALMVTLDAPVQASSRAAQRAGFALPAELAPANLRDFEAPVPRVLAADASIIFQGWMSDAPSWADVAWLRQQTRLPILAKGVAHPADARRLLELGIDGLVVSNHGARTLDGAPASLALLPGIRQMAGAQVPVLLDGGIRSGSDVFKALALGADAVMIGRPQIYALASAGAAGVMQLLRVLRDELELTMALAGCPQLADIGASALYSRNTSC